MPGFVDAHRHLWQTFLRGMLPDCTLETYLRDMLGRIAPHVRPSDGYTGTLLGALECLNAGITTVYDWSHALAGPADSDARIAALVESGIRGFFAPNTPASAEWYSWKDPLAHPADIRRLREEHFADDGGLLRLGAALRSPGQVPDAVVTADWAMARELGLMISIHAGARHVGGLAHEVRTLHRLGLLGPDVNLAHGNEFIDAELDPDEIDYVALGFEQLRRVQRVVESRGWVVPPFGMSDLDAHGMVASTQVMWDYAPAFRGVELEDEDEDVVPLKPTCRFHWEEHSDDGWIELESAGNWRGCEQHRTVVHKLPLTKAGIAALPRLLAELEAPARTLDATSLIECLAGGPCAELWATSRAKTE